MSFLNGVVGGYELRRQFDAPDLVIANSFGTCTGPESVNAWVKSFATRIANTHHVPIIMDLMVDMGEGAMSEGMKLVVSGPISDIKGSGVGTWGVLERASTFMDVHGLNSPLIVGQAYHVNRIAMQAIKLGMDPIVLPGMTRQFDTGSKQIWTRSPALWIPRELLGAVVLKRQAKL